MDPFDMPSTTKVIDCLPHWNTADFPDAFLSELMEHENALPLQDLCINGGHPSSDDWAELDDLRIDEESSGKVTGSFAVSFTEVARSSCRDANWKDPRRGRIEFTLDLKSGEVTFADPMPKREYEADEF